MGSPVIIIGTGLAGYSMAREFRRLDRETPLTLISQDAAGFYSKPMLSNALALGKNAESLVMKPAEKMAEELQANILPHTRVTHINTSTQSITLDSGQIRRYRDLVLALGADPTPPGLQGDALERVIAVNNLEDYARFSQCLQGAQRVAILGAGLIGCEFANDLLNRGITPLIIDPSQGPLSRLLPAQASERLRDQLQIAGVQFFWGRTATQAQQNGQGVRLGLNNHQQLDADLVLSAIGLRPRVALAQAAGIEVHRGIITNPFLRTTAPQVYAMGDCAEVLGLHLPYIMPIMSQARALAATLSGTPSRISYPVMPITVKTPLCPTVVCPPPPQSSGQWHIEVTDNAVEARFLNLEGGLLGFALLGTAVSQRQSWAQQIKPHQ